MAYSKHTWSHMISGPQTWFLCEIDYIDFKEFIEQLGGPNLDDGFCHV